MLLGTDSAKTFLGEELARRIGNNPRYSQRAFARQLGMSPGELSEILRGKRSLSLKSALKIARSLGLNSSETKHLIYLSQVEKSRKLPVPQIDEVARNDARERQLTLDMFHVISDWYCFAI